MSILSRKKARSLLNNRFNL